MKNVVTLREGSMPTQNSLPHMRPMLENIRRNPSAEIACYARQKQGVISLGVGESDQPTPDFIRRAGERALEQGDTFYSPPLGKPELRQELSDYHKRIYGLDIAPERFAVTPSGSTAVHLAFSALFDPGDEVVVVSPLWRNIFCSMQMHDVTIREVTLDVDEKDWSLDLEKLFAAVTPSTRAIVINAPNNPTGWVMGQEDIGRVMDFARARDIWVISDEVYSRMAFGMTRAPSFLDAAGPQDRLIVVNSFSKNWLMTGWRLGWLVVPEGTEKHFYDLALYVSMCPSSIAQAGAMAALRDGEEFLAAQNEHYGRNIDLLMDAYERTGRIRAVRTASGIYSFFSVDGEPDDMALARRLIDEGGLALAPGCAFGSTGGGYLRLCFAVSEDRLRESMRRLEKVLAS